MADFMPAHVGQLRTVITLQTPTIGKDAGGAQSETYANATTNPSVRAKVVFDHGAEAVQSDVKQAVQRATVTIRYRADVLATWRILMNGQPWKIISPPENVQNLNRWLVFQIERVTGTV